MYSNTVNRLRAYVFILLASLPALVFAQSTVNLTLDDASMDEEFLGTGGFTVTRDGSTAGGINVFVEYTGSATINTDFTTTNLVGYIPPVWYIHIPAGQNSTSVVLTPRYDRIK